MLRMFLYSAIFILAMLATTSCSSDPAGASGSDAAGGSLPGNAQNPGSQATAESGLPRQSQTVPGQGQTVPGQAVAGSGGMGQVPPPPGPANPPPSAVQPQSWLTYTNDQFSFAITYPDLYVGSDQGDLPQDVPNLVHRVRFLDKALASSPTANLQPPQFMIDVFENKDGLVLEDWIAANERRATPTKANIGNASGYVVRLQTMQAPNEFYFASHGQYIYRLIPLGQYSSQMLQSFKLG